MPYDASENEWKFPVVSENGQYKGGYITIHPKDKYWLGRKIDGIWETLYKMQFGDKDYSYIILYKFGSKGHTDEDFAKFISLEQAARWLESEHYDLPEDLQKYKKNKPTEIKLNECEKNILVALGKDSLKGEELAKKAGYPYDSTFRQTLSSLRRFGILDNDSNGYSLKKTITT